MPYPICMVYGMARNAESRGERVLILEDEKRLTISSTIARYPRSCQAEGRRHAEDHR